MYPFFRPIVPAAAATGGGACAPPRLRQKHRDDPQVACYAHCRNARQSPQRGGAAAPLSTLSTQNFATCMRECRTCEASRRYWYGAVHPDDIDWAIEHDEEYQELKQEWEASNQDCPYCEQRMDQILAHYYHRALAPWRGAWR